MNVTTYQEVGTLDLGGVVSLDLPQGEIKGYFEVAPKCHSIFPRQIRCGPTLNYGNRRPVLLLNIRMGPIQESLNLA